MKLAASLVTLSLVACIGTATSTPALSHAQISRSLIDRCMSEPVSNDHLSCGSVYRQAYARARPRTVVVGASKPALRRHARTIARHYAVAKPAPRHRTIRVARLDHENVSGKRLSRAPVHSRVSASHSAVTNHRLEALNLPHASAPAPRLHQASAYCGRPANRATWECSRYFLLAPYEAKNVQRR